MDSIGGQHVKWIKSEPERQTPHVLSYMWEPKLKIKNNRKRKRKERKV